MKELMERRQEIWHAMKALLATTAGRTMSGTEEDTWQKMEADLAQVTRAIKINERGDELAAELDGPANDGDVTRHLEPHPATPGGPAGTAAVQGVARTATPGSFGHDYDYARAFDGYLRLGADRLPREARNVLDAEGRALSTTNAAGGYTVQMLRDTLENWQSEFPQLLWQVGGLAPFLYLGSPQSREGEERKEAKLDAILRRLGSDGERTIAELDQKYPGQ